jgi:GWxTD domain-containing protein
VRTRLSALLLLLAPLAPLLGQTPSDRLALDRLHDSLVLVSDTTSLRSEQRAPARRPDADALGSLRAALVSLRLAELGADPSAGDARRELRRLTNREPAWPYAWHALATAELRRAAWLRASPLELGNRVGTGAVEDALEHERRAIAADPGFVPAALTLARLALELHDTSLYAGARDALRRADAAHAAPPADLLLARGRLERATGEADSAVAVFERAAARGPASGEPGRLARLELARTQMAAASGAGEALYFAGASDDDSAVVAGYRADLAPIAADADLARFDAVRGEGRAAFLHRFWSDRDRAELRQDGERLREHYRRLLYARRHFALTISRRFYGSADAYRSGSEELDDRGIIYVRHGEPAERLRPFVFGLMPNETWRYGRADGDLLFHFSAGYDSGTGGGDLYDYRLVESVLDLHGAADAPVDQLLLSRSKLSPLYGRMLNWGRYGAAHARARERGIGRASVDFGTTTDSYELRFAHRLTAYADLVAVGQRGGVPLAHFVFAVGPGETTPLPAIAGVRYPVRVRLVALDGADHAVSGADTTLEFRLDRALGRGQYLVGRVELPLPAGLWGWRAALSEGPDAGVVLPRDTVRVAAPGPALSLSDLALGIRSASARWVPAAGADTVYLTPFDLFLEGSEVELYYEAGGAAAGSTYRHQIAVYRSNDAGRTERRPVVTLGFEERADGALIRAQRTLQLGRLKPGTYVVEVKVGDAAGEPLVRRRQLRVVRPER